VTGTEFQTTWWYYVSDDAVYLLGSRDDLLVDSLKTTMASLQRDVHALEFSQPPHAPALER